MGAFSTITRSSRITLCLSGGGYRAMLFHLGGIWRLNELGFLPAINCITSASGGAILAARLAARWGSFTFANNVATNFKQEIAWPICEIASRTLSTPWQIEALFRKTFVPHKLASALKWVTEGRFLGDLRPKPRFVFKAACYETGEAWAFSNPLEAGDAAAHDLAPQTFVDPRLGLWEIAAACIAAPPLPPVTFGGLGRRISWPEAAANHPDSIALFNGSLDDNFGFDLSADTTLMISDGGFRFDGRGHRGLHWLNPKFPLVNWTAEKIYRVRRDALKERLTANDDPVYWDIEGSIDQFQARNVLDCDPEVTRTAAAAGSDLSGIEEPLQDALIDWGYALADAAIRSRMSESLSVKPPAASPKGVFYCQPKKSSMGAA